MIPRLGNIAFPSVLALLALLGGCGATNAGIPFASAHAPAVQPPKQEQNLSSFSAQLYGNETKPYNGSSGPHPVLRRPERRRIPFQHGVPRT